MHQAFLFLEEAAESGDVNIVNYVLNKFKSYDDLSPFSTFNYLIRGAAKKGDIEILSYVTKTFPKQEIRFDTLLEYAASKGQVDFLRAFIQPENSKMLLKLLPSVIEILAYSENRDVQNPYTKEKTLRFLLDTYFSLGGKKKSFDIVPEREIEDKNTLHLFHEYGF